MITVLFVVHEYLSLTGLPALLNDPNVIVTAWLLAIEISYNEYRSVVITLALLVQPLFLRVVFILKTSGPMFESSGLIEKVMASALSKWFLFLPLLWLPINSES